MQLLAIAYVFMGMTTSFGTVKQSATKITKPTKEEREKNAIKNAADRKNLLGKPIKVQEYELVYVNKSGTTDSKKYEYVQKEVGEEQEVIANEAMLSAMRLTDDLVEPYNRPSTEDEAVILVDSQTRAQSSEPLYAVIPMPLAANVWKYVFAGEYRGWIKFSAKATSDSKIELSIIMHPDFVYKQVQGERPYWDQFDKLELRRGYTHDLTPSEFYQIQNEIYKFGDKQMKEELKKHHEWSFINAGKALSYLNPFTGDSLKDKALNAAYNTTFLLSSDPSQIDKIYETVPLEKMREAISKAFKKAVDVSIQRKNDYEFVIEYSDNDGVFAKVIITNFGRADLTKFLRDQVKKVIDAEYELSQESRKLKELINTKQKQLEIDFEWMDTDSVKRDQAELTKGRNELKEKQRSHTETIETMIGEAISRAIIGVENEFKKRIDAKKQEILGPAPGVKVTTSPVSK